MICGDYKLARFAVDFRVFDFVFALGVLQSPITELSVIDWTQTADQGSRSLIKQLLLMSP
jgi:hypothetical protein